MEPVDRPDDPGDVRRRRERVKQMPLHDPIVYEDGKERRSLDLRPDGVACIPMLGLSNFQTARTGTEEHVHPGCVEVSLCVRVNLMFESQGESYPFLPGTVFVSQPMESHRMRHNPKGLMLYRILFKSPDEGENVLDLKHSDEKIFWQDYLEEGTKSGSELYAATVSKVATPTAMRRNMWPKEWPTGWECLRATSL